MLSQKVDTGSRRRRRELAAAVNVASEEIVE
jgi:hypothetical protein